MNAAEERTRMLAGRVGEWPLRSDEREAIARRLEIPGRSNNLMVGFVFFLLTSLAIAATFYLFDLLQLPKGWLTAGLCIALAEVLMRRFHFAGTGVEEALWVGGLFAWIFGLEGSGKQEVLLIFAAACVIAGLRVRNALVVTAAAIFAIAYFGAKSWYVAALLAGLVIAAIALAALVIEWRRPSFELLFVALLIAAPVTGAACSIGRTSSMWAFAYAALATAAIAFGIRFRHRAALTGGSVAAAIAAIIVLDTIDVAIEWKLIACGALLIAISATIARSLRGRTRGFVVTAEKNAYEEWLRVFGTPAIAPQVAPSTATPQIAGGGNFGGAGTTGSF